MRSGDQVGSWILGRPIGGGGMGRVYLARHATTGRQGALKTLLEHGRDKDAIARFHREIAMLESLRHPAIVDLLDHGELNGRPWMVMEYATGDSLGEVLARGRAMSAERAVLELAALADGLRAAHELGIHHRDIKADNVVMHADGRCLLADFGAALQRGGKRLTAAGDVMGTLAYLAPEVLEGGERDPASTDIYALGQLLCEVLQGKPLFPEDEEAGSRDRFAQLLVTKSQPLDPGAPVRESARELVRKATQPEPEDRFRTMAEMALALREALPLADRSKLDRRLGGAPLTRKRSPVAVALAVGLTLVAGAACAGASVGVLAILALIAGG